jgi:uncharacterized membrane protein YgcG
MRGKNWVDEDDPGEERVFGLGHRWCQGEAQRIDVERRLAADLEAVKIEPELDPITDAIGQPPFVPRTRRPTAYWDMRSASKRDEPIDSQACKYSDPNCTDSRPKGVPCDPCRLEHCDEYDGMHCENYCNRFTCMFESPIQHSLGDCVRCMERPSCTICPHCITDSRSCARIYACNAIRAADKNGPPGRGGGGGHGGGPGPGGGGGGDPGSSDGNGRLQREQRPKQRQTSRPRRSPRQQPPWPR